MSECHAYCEHGGYCVLPLGHECDHSSGFCTWDYQSSIDKATADERFLDVDPLNAPWIIKVDP